MTTPQQEIESWRIRAWEEARSELGEWLEKLLAEGETPAVKATPDPEKVQGMIMRRGLIQALIHSSYLYELTRSTALFGGYVTGNEITALLTETRALCDVAARGAQALCKAAPCDWKGLVADCGPARACPKCGSKNIGAGVIDTTEGLVLPPG